MTLNYRLGPLGFLALPELERTYGATGGGVASATSSPRCTG